MTGPAAAVEGGNVYDKYGSRHPVERRLVSRFLGELADLVESTGAQEVHEVGCGEGEIARMLAQRGLRVRGSDVSAAVVKEAAARARAAGVHIDFKAASLDRLDPREDAADLVVCCEVLEHVEDAQGGLEIVAGLARPWAILSVPREPLWRALNLLRGAYVRDLGNTPGHLNHWSRGGFLRFLERRFEVVAVRSPLPWTMALCRTRPGPGASTIPAR
jgi:2-polyprenyl-3-methyl-5-hydroxy-6-metoxy-1,4-benzoquinol methylase